MIDLGFAALLALIAAGFGKRILDGLGCSPDHPLDALALAVPLGMGLTALATLALGELGCLNFVGLSVLLAVLIELGIIAWFNLFRQTRAWFRTRVTHAQPNVPFSVLRALPGARADRYGDHRGDAGHRRRRSLLSPPGAQGVLDARVGRVPARPP